ncbi:hypothetical protein M2325_001262 [Methanococcus voltae PS]|uniref:Uncharacterized protein n=1 Tax=Methanococcus voltae PS TaxID=523842 RepID=A0ABT2EX70_METVO|nr:hypothetical protein [Methanococcus voltae]MCS3922566.1 hypothetical protein [Methanococcus voltae PS]
MNQIKEFQEMAKEQFKNLAIPFVKDQTTNSRLGINFYDDKLALELITGYGTNRMTYSLESTNVLETLKLQKQIMQEAGKLMNYPICWDSYITFNEHTKKQNKKIYDEVKQAGILELNKVLIEIIEQDNNMLEISIKEENGADKLSILNPEIRDLIVLVDLLDHHDVFNRIEGL